MQIAWKVLIVFLLFGLNQGAHAQISASKTQSLQVDADTNHKAGPGDAIRYTVVITNTAGSNLFDVVFNDIIGSNTTLVAGSIRSTPLARPDLYSAIGNTTLSVPAASGVLTNDSDPDGDAVGVVAFAAVSAQGGTVMVANDGGFSYLPPAGFKGADSFAYTIGDGHGGSNSSLATIMVSDMVWYVNNAGANGDGRQSSPLNSFGGINGAGGAGDFDGANDIIYLFQGSGSYGSGLALESGQKLIGAGAALVVGGTTIYPAGSRPTLGLGGAGATCAANNLIQGLDIVATAGKGVSGAGFGTLTISNASITSTGGAALDLATGTLAITLDSASSMNSSAEGLRLSNVNGTFTAVAGNISAPTGAGIFISGETAGVTYPGNVTKNNAGRVVDISGKSGGTVALNGAMTQVAASGTGISLVNNSGATISFGGVITLSTSANAAFSATGGGTVTATASGSTLTTTSGAALNVVNTTIGAGGLTFQSISCNGAVNGIVLNATGSSGGLTVTGSDGADAGTVPDAGSGGTIQNTSGHGISLAGTTDVRLGGMTVRNNLGSGISGSSINGFVLDGATITGNGNDAASDESGINLSELTGTSSGGAHPTAIRNSTISNNNEFELQITDTTGLLADFQLHDNTISCNGFGINGNATSPHGNLVNFLALGSASMTLNAVGGSYSGNLDTSGGRIITATGIQADHSGSGGTVNANISGAAFTNNNVSVSVSAANGGSMTFDVNGNTASRSRSHNLNLFIAANSVGSVNGKFRNNIVGQQGVPNSGSEIGYGIRVQNEAKLGANILISGNTIQGIGAPGAGFAGINVNHGIVGATTVNQMLSLTIANNTIRDVYNSRAIVVQQNDSGNPGMVCANVSGNQMSNIAGNVGDGTCLRFRQLSGGVFRCTQTDLNNLAAVNGIGAGQISVGGTVTYNQSPCMTPP
ncbi:MAG TPA: hypothetical protein DCZ95_17640 [Verrucomicrobia bacterium]|nr:MAG: hypothetical protein A2X46_12230 [Lentisphaerae bacterium GWF2_57_35]HBA85910.1 hypothetical protein [Verrucomicrobiota bacterium]